MKVVHINKDFDRVREYAEQLVKKWKQQDKEKAQKKYFKQTKKKSA